MQGIVEDPAEKQLILPFAVAFGLDHCLRWIVWALLGDLTDMGTQFKGGLCIKMWMSKLCWSDLGEVT